MLKFYTLGGGSVKEEKLIIRQTKKGIALYIFGAIVMSLSSLVIALLEVETIRGILYRLPLINLFTITPSHVLAVRAFMLFGAFFFGLCLIFIVRRAKSKEILIADERGITDRSSAIALGFIPWRDIASIRLRLFMNQKFIEIELKNKEKYLNELGWFKKGAIKMNEKTGFQAGLITLNGSGVNPETVLPKLEMLFERYKI